MPTAPSRRPFAPNAYRVLGEAQNALAAPQDWSKIAMKPEASTALAEAAHVLRFADADGAVTTPIRPERLPRSRRGTERARRPSGLVEDRHEAGSLDGARRSRTRAALRRCRRRRHDAHSPRTPTAFSARHRTRSPPLRIGRRSP